MSCLAPTGSGGKPESPDSQVFLVISNDARLTSGSLVWARGQYLSAAQHAMNEGFQSHLLCLIAKHIDLDAAAEWASRHKLFNKRLSEVRIKI